MLPSGLVPALAWSVRPRSLAEPSGRARSADGDVIYVTWEAAEALLRSLPRQRTGRDDGTHRCSTQTDLFGPLPPELLAQLRDRTALERSAVRRHLREGRRRRRLSSCSRAASRSRESCDGRESVISVLGPGALFGEMSLFDGGLRSAEARALTTVT